MKCNNCGIEFESKRKGTEYCSPRCRKQAFLKRSVGTDNLAFQVPEGTDKFEFRVTVGNTDPATPPFNDEGTVKTKSVVRTAKYWYDVPVSAQPIIKKGWPKKPDYINGRQYYLWWKNDFKVGTGISPFDGPILWNPFDKA
jgi:hypothetical protein